MWLMSRPLYISDRNFQNIFTRFFDIKFVFNLDYMTHNINDNLIIYFVVWYILLSMFWSNEIYDIFEYCTHICFIYQYTWFMTQIYPIFLNARTHAHKNIATLIRGNLTFLGIVVMTNKLLLSHVQIHMTWIGVESFTYYV